MSCESHCCGIEKLFSEKKARKKLQRYRDKGPEGTTKELLAQFSHVDVSGKTILDIGGGIGVLQRELMKAGATSATDVDASEGSLRVAREEAVRQNHATTFLHGDFTLMADQVEPADIVTLDKVICCYPKADDLMAKALDKARSYVGLVLPRDTLVVRATLFIQNILVRFFARGFRSYLHSPRSVHALIESCGLRRLREHRMNAWLIWLYGREGE
jgi:magnesium-protoporphyrin O-methyltransferase